MLLLLFLNWQKNLSATFFESHSYDNVKLYTIVDIHGLLETHIHFLMWIDICTNSDRNFFILASADGYTPLQNRWGWWRI